jgi:hypothetical protein
MSFVVQALTHTSRALLLCHAVLLMWSIGVTIHCNCSMLCVYGDGLLPLVQLPSDAQVGADALHRPHVLLTIAVLLLGGASAMIYLMLVVAIASLAPAADATRRQLGRACAFVLIVALLLEFLHSLIVVGHAGFTGAAAAETRNYMLEHDIPFAVSFVATVCLRLTSPALHRAPVPVEPPPASRIWWPIKWALGVVAAVMLLLAAVTFCLPSQALDAIRHFVGDRSMSMHEIVHSGNAHPFAFVSLAVPLEFAMVSTIAPLMMVFAIRSESDLMAACCLVPNLLMWSGALLALALQDSSLMRTESKPVGIDPAKLNRWIVAMFVATVVASLLQAYVMRCAWLQHRSRTLPDDIDVASMRRGDDSDAERTESSVRSVSDSDSVGAAPLPAAQRMHPHGTALRPMYSADDRGDEDEDSEGGDAVLPARQLLPRAKAGEAD